LHLLDNQLFLIPILDLFLEGLVGDSFLVPFGGNSFISGWPLVLDLLDSIFG